MGLAGVHNPPLHWPFSHLPGRVPSRLGCWGLTRPRLWDQQTVPWPPQPGNRPSIEDGGSGEEGGRKHHGEKYLGWRCGFPASGIYRPHVENLSLQKQNQEQLSFQALAAPAGVGRGPALPFPAAGNPWSCSLAEGDMGQQLASLPWEGRVGGVGSVSCCTFSQHLS